MKSLSGATMISCFFDLIRRNVRSLVGSKSRTTLRALSANCPINPAYCTVEVLSKVLLTATPTKKEEKIIETKEKNFLK